MKLTGVLLIETVTFGYMSFFSASMVKVYTTLNSCSEMESSSSATSRVESSPSVRVAHGGALYLVFAFLYFYQTYDTYTITQYIFQNKSYSDKYMHQLRLYAADHC